ncbi:MAG: hypothetical protein CVU43_12740 [Chloroflexi bacterium HGW-Chloroflexi-5]|jgi:hypothetical protein|nr:MAG: hypothetical protein CVU43_12740 [Chloroflexi bacterium HGW-Chloroflexi-5]
MKKILWVGLFAIAMAFLEAAVVVYLRRLYGISDLLLTVPPFDPQIARIELGRELATLVMLLSLGWIAGQKLQSRLGFTLVAFGVWDIFYYLWLKVFIAWPTSLLDPDLLFLIPLPWWGPVIAPILISLVMIMGGTLGVIMENQGNVIRFRITEMIALLAGILAMLYAFMQDAISILPASESLLSQLKPSQFNWAVFLAGLFLSGFVVWRVTKRT